MKTKRPYTIFNCGRIVSTRGRCRARYFPNCITVLSEPYSGLEGNLLCPRRIDCPAVLPKLTGLFGLLPFFARQRRLAYW